MLNNNYVFNTQVLVSSKMLKISYIPPSEHAYQQVESLFQALLKSGVNVCGFDTETTAIFTKNQRPDQIINVEEIRTSTIQICVKLDFNGAVSDLETVYDDPAIYTSYIFHLNNIYSTTGRIPPSFVRFLQNESIVKVGCAITQDCKKLKKEYSLRTKSTIEIQTLCRSNGDMDYSLEKLSKKYLNLRKLDSKFGNYDIHLNKEQIEYAAYDSYLSLMVYHKLTKFDISLKNFYFYVSDKTLEKISLDDAVKFLEFLTSMNAFNSSTLTDEKILNIAMNSYSKWRSNTNDCRNKVKQAIKLLSDDGLIVKQDNGWILFKEYEILQESIQKDNKIKDFSKHHPYFYSHVLGLTKKLITQHGIKKESLITALSNSMVNFDNGFISSNIEEEIKVRLRYLNSAINEMVLTGILVLINNKLYKIEDKNDLLIT